MITKTAVMTAIIAVCTFVSIPTPFGISITLQTFAVVLTGAFLGPVYGIFSVLAYIALGAVGVPVFSNFSGGAQVLVGVTGGFIFGFIPLAVLAGIKTKHIWLDIIISCVGICVCHIIGVMQFSLVTHNMFFASFLTVSFPFLLKDFISAALAVFLVRKITKRYPNL